MAKATQEIVTVSTNIVKQFAKMGNELIQVISDTEKLDNNLRKAREKYQESGKKANTVFAAHVYELHAAAPDALPIEKLTSTDKTTVEEVNKYLLEAFGIKSWQGDQFLPTKEYRGTVTSGKEDKKTKETAAHGIRHKTSNKLQTQFNTARFTVASMIEKKVVYHGIDEATQRIQISNAPAEMRGDADVDTVIKLDSKSLDGAKEKASLTHFLNDGKGKIPGKGGEKTAVEKIAATGAKDTAHFGELCNGFIAAINRKMATGFDEDCVKFLEAVNTASNMAIENNVYAGDEVEEAA